MTAETDHQYQKTGTAQEPSATEQRQSTESHNLTAFFLYGCGVVKTRTNNQCQRLLIMITLATAMRAANVADFYMTKYLSKAQEALGPVIQPFIAGMCRIASAESAREAAESSLVQRARQRIRRFIFCAHRTMWFSACELGVFLAIGDRCVETETTTKVFSGKGMMHECKRLLNHSTAAEGLLLARSSTQRTKVGCTIMEAFASMLMIGCLQRQSGYLIQDFSSSELLKNTCCQQVLRAKHLWTSALVAMVAKPRNFL